MTEIDMTRDHAELSDTFAARRYFRKFEAITGHLTRVAATMESEKRLSKLEARVIGSYVQMISATFRALSLKYLMTGRTDRSFGGLDIDRVESGFPVFREVLTMSNDAQQVDGHLRGLKRADQLKSDMIAQIVGEQTIPTKLQFAMSQRLYYEALQDGDLFWAQNHPQAQWLRNLKNGRRTYLIWWAVYDSQVNLPTLYLMELEDSGRHGLPIDDRRWPEVQRHLMAQAVGGLKLVTIAKGFDQDFDDLHPKRLRRFHVGPMYSSAFTRQRGPLREVLEEARAPVGQDWTLSWTEEVLESDRVEQERSGWFGTVDREIFALDPFSGRGVDTGATRTERAIIMPARPYQVLAEKTPPGFRDVRKFVVSDSGQVVSYR
ncbi:hypothetical protein AIOL_000485 [Candidatus Rhodobacter oscarellae]|uniref:Uncharacterized protein n=1 Tax=Candidatus Rhodobacter oscarellae TaxID=1675527 RepID=A0A0J9EC33_9RHOB|nr:hypothetical protein [Candidatus Rhodobacter lobularis]KMW60332.1 hypothetical protein AIOL_000485 [Candidatus Rhodobacter lobularis]